MDMEGMGRSHLACGRDAVLSKVGPVLKWAFILAIVLGFLHVLPKKVDGFFWLLFWPITLVFLFFKYFYCKGESVWKLLFDFVLHAIGFAILNMIPVIGEIGDVVVLLYSILTGFELMVCLFFHRTRPCQ